MSSFLWGAATSSHQVEGYCDHNDWAEFERRGFVEGGAKSGPATDHWNRFRDDLKIAKDLGLNSYRFSVEWSKIEPKPGKWNREALDWYLELLLECEKLRLEPMVTLHHFTSPLWFFEEGGFTVPESKTRFSHFVKRVVQHLSGKVRFWCTVNEPMVLAVGSYLAKIMPPGEFSPSKTIKMSRNLFRCHLAAYEIIHSESRLPAQVGIAHSLIDFRPDRASHLIDRFFARAFDRFYNRSWLDALCGRRQHFGVLGFLPRAKPVARALGKVNADFIGVNYYTCAYVRWAPFRKVGLGPRELPLELAFSRRKETVSDMGWSIHPEGLAKMLRMAAGYGLPLYVTENGIADSTDSLRAAFIEEHVRVVSQLRREGVDIRGYFYWSLLDNFEWIKGFGPRFGLVHVDYESYRRTIRDSARRYSQLIRELS